MRYISTRGGAPAVSFTETLLAGLAPDGGLYVPQTWPSVSRDEIAAFAGQPYAKAAAAILARFAGEDFTTEEIAADCEAAYATFSHRAVAPLQPARSKLMALGAVLGSDPGVQGRGDAAACAAL